MASNRSISIPGSAAAISFVVAIAAGASIVLAACAPPPPAAPSDDPVLVQGQEIYARNCASCHGSAGGGGVGPKLSEGAVLAAYPNIKDQIDLVSQGRGNMPAYQDRLSGQEQEAVVRYTREVLS